MLFPTYEFCFIYLPIALLGYFGISKISKNKNTQYAFLLIMSVGFYGYSNICFTILLIFSILVNYSLVWVVQESKKKNIFISKVCFILGIIFNLILIGYYKYFNFFVENINVLFKQNFFIEEILLPLGISFFTFQQISLLIDVYQERTVVDNFLKYSLFISFFPQLIAGPIVVYSEMQPQMQDENKLLYNFENFSRGMYLFSIGLFKKIILADSLALIANNGFAVMDYGLGTSWVTALSYTFQIYFDFSGYTDMARGLGKMFNFELPLNFDSPYKAKSIQEFWKRWHMTLSRMLRHCIYFPLGGNRKGKIKMYFALFITFFLSGVWHGAAWNFILWGTLYGILFIMERMLQTTISKIPIWLRGIGTFLTVNFLWVLFGAGSFDKSKNILWAMIFGNIQKIDEIAILANDFGIGTKVQLGFIILLLGTSFFITMVLPNSNKLEEQFKPSTVNEVFVALLFILSVIGMTRISTFIYFNF